MITVFDKLAKSIKKSVMPTKASIQNKLKY